MITPSLGCRRAKHIHILLRSEPQPRDGVYSMFLLFVNHAVTEFCKFSSVPAACGTHEVACDALKLVDVLSTAVRTLGEILLCILESAVHTTVAVVVDRTISDVIFIHKVNNVHYRLRIVCGISVNLDIEYVSAAGECVVRTFNLSLVLRSTFIIYWHVVGVGVIVLVSNARDDSEFLLVAPCEAITVSANRFYTFNRVIEEEHIYNIWLIRKMHEML